MSRTYLEELQAFEQREADRRMVRRALRQRRHYRTSRSVIAIIFWLLRIR
jgi:hypothetical protein